MVMRARDIGMLVYNKGLIPISHLLHVVLDEFPDFLICHMVSFAGIHRRVEGHILTAQAAAFEFQESLHRVFRILNGR